MLFGAAVGFDSPDTVELLGALGFDFVDRFRRRCYIRKPNSSRKKLLSGDHRRSKVPLYDYLCDSCGHIFELRQSFSAATEGPCPRCQGNSRRRFHAVPIIYKGSGFYTTDYKKTGYSPPGKTEESDHGHSDDKGGGHGHSHDSGSKEEVASSSSSSDSSD